MISVLLGDHGQKSVGTGKSGGRHRERACVIARERTSPADLTPYETSTTATQHHQLENADTLKPSRVFLRAESTARSKHPGAQSKLG